MNKSKSSVMPSHVFWFITFTVQCGYTDIQRRLWYPVVQLDTYKPVALIIWCRWGFFWPRSCRYSSLNNPRRPSSMWTLLQTGSNFCWQQWFRKVIAYIKMILHHVLMPELLWTDILVTFKPCVALLIYLTLSQSYICGFDVEKCYDITKSDESSH